MKRVFAFCLLSIWFAPLASAAENIDFNRDIRPIFSNTCFRCHGPDEKERKGGSEGADGLRLDSTEGATRDLGGYAAIVPGKPEESEVVKRITSTDPDVVMPPGKGGKKLSAREIELVTEWIRQGGKFSKHWSYEKPVKPALPEVADKSWPKTDVDRFLLARLEREGLKPQPEADRHTLIRRLMLDLTGLPPTIEEVDEFVADKSPDAYEKLVERVLKKETYGEHWARMWLDLARYADSAGYADDPPRKIWAYRDYVIKSLNANKPFDQFTIEQIAGDLLPNPTPEQLIATAFHRNTLTNNEGGTNDEEYRNVAIVDRVNTTMAVWMGTSMACAQCHTHKYDPITQEEYFRFLAILNNTEDADRADESPLHSYYTPEQESQRAALQTEIAALEKVLTTPTPELEAALAKWEVAFPKDLAWNSPKPTVTTKSGVETTVRDDSSVLVARSANTDVYTLTLPVAAEKLSALRLEALTDDSLPGKGPGHANNFVVSRVTASVAPKENKPLTARYVRIQRPGKQTYLMLAEVEVFSGTQNVAVNGESSQISTGFEGAAKRANDGNTNGKYFEANSVSHTEKADDPWWEVDLKSSLPLDRVVVWQRTDNGESGKLTGVRVAALNENRETVWDGEIKEAAGPSHELSLSGGRSVVFITAYADHVQKGFEPQNVLDNKDVKSKGWAVSPNVGKPSTLTLIAKEPIATPADQLLTITIEQLSQFENHTLGCFRVSVSDDARTGQYVTTPANIVAILKTPVDQRSPEQAKSLFEYFTGNIAAELKEPRDKLAGLKKQLEAAKPVTVPILRELAANARRKTKLQHRGNFLDVGQEVTEGVPAAFHPIAAEGSPNRLALAKWLVDENNPLTPRVIANRYWEQVFGIGLVRTSEEFGSQGELPSHPELLDYLATELIGLKWNMKDFLKLLVTSAAYRQSSKVSPELFERDPENRLLARGPRFRLSAEMIRDQALAVSGLLSPKMYGPSVKPPRPSLGLSAAFGSGLDWQTSAGEDKFRRGLYTEWRRTSPYPSMVTFDAPNREVCTIRRNLTNTPLQALVTLNDPVYVEASQALARQMSSHGSTLQEKLSYGFRRCVSRPPTDAEVKRLLALYEEAKSEFAKDAAKAKQMAESPLGPAPEGADVADLAAWTVVSNVLLNLDELLMKR